MVAYTAPVFWTFFLLSGLTLFQFRRRGEPSDGFRVPLYPVVPLAFSAACLYMLYSSIDYIGNPDYGPKFGALVVAGLLVMVAGVPLYWATRRA
jgi:amino acid transporter